MSPTTDLDAIKIMIISGFPVEFKEQINISHKINPPSCFNGTAGTTTKDHRNNLPD